MEISIFNGHSIQGAAAVLFTYSTYVSMKAIEEKAATLTKSVTKSKIS
jgi:hypothetical protein